MYVWVDCDERCCSSIPLRPYVLYVVIQNIYQMILFMMHEKRPKNLHKFRPFFLRGLTANKIVPPYFKKNKSTFKKISTKLLNADDISI